MTRYNYKLPDLNGKPGEERPYCATCILAWADIDAKIELVGCDQYNATKGTGTYNYSSGPEDPDSFYYCDNGTWYVCLLYTSSHIIIRNIAYVTKGIEDNGSFGRLAKYLRSCRNLGSW